MVAIGTLDRRITIERASFEYNEFNEPIETWATLATVCAGRNDVSDMEKVAAGGVGSVLISRFVVRSTPVSRDFHPIDRVIHDDRQWNIDGIKQTRHGRNRFLEITAKTGG